MEDSIEFKELDRQKRCSECGKTKPLSLFSVTETGKRRKPFCKKCEVKLFTPKRPPKIVGRGRPIFGLGGSSLKVGELKEVGEVRIRGEKEVEGIVKRNIRESRERVKKQRKTQRMSETMEKRLKVQEEATKFYEEVIVDFIEQRGEGFTAMDLRKYISRDIGKKEPTSQWVVGMLRTLAKLKLLKISKKRGGKNTYFLKDTPINKDAIALKETLEKQKKEEKKRKEKIRKKVKLDLEKVEVIELDKGKIPVREEEEDQIMNKPFEPTKAEWRELMKNKEKILKGEEDKGCDDDFLRGISTIADEVHINFVTRETEVILSPNGNLLRVYDLLSKKQKETAEVDGKNLKFYW